MKILKSIVILTCAIFLTSCATPHLGVYTIDMNRVDKIPELSDSESQSTITLPDGTTQYVYADETIRIVWSLTKTSFAFELENLAKQSIKIPWDDATYVNQNGISKKVIHDGIKYEDKGNPQPATVIARHSKITDFLIPSDNIVSENRNFNTWKTYHLFYDKKANVGQQVCIVLPVLLGDERMEYAFYFKVSSWTDPTPAKKGFFSSIFKK